LAAANSLQTINIRVSLVRGSRSLGVKAFA